MITEVRAQYTDLALGALPKKEEPTGAAVHLASLPRAVIASKLSIVSIFPTTASLTL